MLYKKSQSNTLSKELFRRPTSEYRAAPLWSWNCSLTPEMLTEQIDYLKEMGMGGSHIHVRTGLDTEYLGEEFMHLVKICVEHGKKNQMLTWLYDEDRWPSGFAGGIVTKEKKYRARYLLFTPVSYEEDSSSRGSTDDSSARATRSGNGQLLACYDVRLHADGSLKDYRRIGKDAPAEGRKWYAYMETPAPNPWFNNQTYVNTLDKKAIERFIEVTYESYKKAISDDFGTSVPAIFTDEPQFSRKTTLDAADELKDVTFPWTDDLPDTFRAAYGEELLDNLPQLFWDLPEGKPSLIRYHYHDHIAERFSSAYADTCGAWCRAHSLMLTGHMMEEPTLRSQTAALGEAMRSYRGFELPGIDMLCAQFEYTTAKQAQSAVHQFGREGMMSELYGVTGWTFDFRSHKLHGDWQAALGVTLRVPHLSWVSMAGESKRDYPASLNYQAPWFREYRLVEDHFGRLATVLTRGRPAVRVAVVHPVESYWLHWGPAKQTALIRDQMDTYFQDLTKWLLFGSVDFDFISESLLPTLCAEGGNPLQVGCMTYDAVIVPNCETLRSTTVERLRSFRKQGGRLLFMGDVPTLMDAVPSEEPKQLAAMSEQIAFSRAAVLRALDDLRTVDIRNADGSLTDTLLHQLRRDGDKLWLFIAHGTEPYNKDVVRVLPARITVRGLFTPVLYNTLTGETEPMAYTHKNGNTVLARDLYDYDSLLIELTPASEASSVSFAEETAAAVPLPFPGSVPVTLAEPNVLLLDMGEFSLDDEPFHPCEELLRADNVCRDKLGWPQRKSAIAQPWVIAPEEVTHHISLRLRFNSELALSGCKLAMEDAETAVIRLNGEPVASAVDGWYVDHAIRTVPLPALKKGENLLELVLPFGRRTNVEWCYILGDFGVRTAGREKTITEPVRTLGFSDITAQGLPFYGGNIVYHIDVDAEKDGTLVLETTHFRGALVSAELDGQPMGKIFLPPYTCEQPVKKGRHTLDVTLYGNRYNTFGSVHLTDEKHLWSSPDAWRSTGCRWSYEYQLSRTGLLSSPRVYLK